MTTTPTPVDHAEAVNRVLALTRGEQCYTALDFDVFPADAPRWVAVVNTTLPKPPRGAAQPVWYVSNSGQVLFLELGFHPSLLVPTLLDAIRPDMESEHLPAFTDGFFAGVRAQQR